MKGMRSPGWATALSSWRSELSGGFDDRAETPAASPGRAAGLGPPGPRAAGWAGRSQFLPGPCQATSLLLV